MTESCICLSEGTRYDVGEKMGFIKTTIEFALQREDLRDELLKYLAGIVEKERMDVK